MSALREGLNQIYLHGRRGILQKKSVVSNEEIFYIKFAVLYAIEKGLKMNSCMVQEMKAAQYVLVTMDARKDQQVR
jgi:hypothetical protein